MKMRIAFAGVLILTFLAVCAITEIWLRYVGLGYPVLYQMNNAYRYAPQPNQQVERFASAMVTIDSSSLRSTEDWSKQKGIKILFVGDSVTYGGSYIDDKQTFAHRTCQLLETQRDLAFACGNAGVNAYGVDNMSARITFDPVVAKADILVVTLIAHDAIRGLVDLRSLYYYTVKPPPPFRAIWEAAGFVLRRIADEMTHRRERVDRSFDMLVARASLARLFEAIGSHEAKGKAVLINYSPDRSEMENGPNRLETLVKDEIAQSGFAYVNFSEILATAAGLDKVYHDGVHLDIAGHEMYAEQVAAEISTMIGR